MTHRVQLLSDHVANKIAAGEVVERPASVFKELIENAIDAGATDINVEVLMGGCRLLKISDNGIGMNRDNALLALERHATSKIRDVDDIEQINTLGFRGEALAAIASVSRFVLLTRARGDLSGTEIMVNGGKIQDVRDAGCPEGTEIAVRNLFYNVPARRKFLKAENTELSHIRQVFFVYALAHPGLALRLLAEERELYNLPAAKTLRDRLTALYPADVVDHLREVDHEWAGGRVHGLVGLPQTSRSDKRDQYVFINGRPSSAPLIGYAIGEAYNGLFPKGRFPVVFLHIDVDPSAVDVNVHPMKREVRFRKGNDVRDLVIQGLAKALSGESGTGEGGGMDKGESAPSETPAVDSGISGSGATLGSGASLGSGLSVGSGLLTPMPPPPPAQRPDGSVPVPPISPELLKGLRPDGAAYTGAAHTGAAHTGATPEAQAPQHHPVQPELVAPDEVANPSQASARQGPRGPWQEVRIVGEIKGGFVLLETDQGLVIMDPESARERVLFEAYMDSVLAGSVQSQGLLPAETVSLAPADARRVREQLDLLERMGFGIGEFGGDTFMVDAMPAFLSELAAKDILADVAATFEQSGKRGGTETWAEEAVARATSRSSSRRRETMAPAELSHLIDQLAAARMPYASPSGKPTLIFQSFSDIQRKFGRK